MRWLRGLYARYESWRFKRWLRSPDGQRYIAATSWLAEHGTTTTLHELSPSVAASWSAEVNKSC